MSNYGQNIKEGLYNFLALLVAVLTGVAFVWLMFSCKMVRDFTIPSEPTIWVVSEVYEDEKNPFPNGLVGYKFIPVNPGSINAKATWKVDYKGKYTVGQRVDFTVIPADASRPVK